MSHRDGTTAQAKEYRVSTDRPGALSPTPESGRHPNPRKDQDISQSVAVAIGALFATSGLLRILTVFVSVRMGPEGRRYVERGLPAAVFINFAVYIAYYEVVRESPRRRRPRWPW